MGLSKLFLEPGDLLSMLLTLRPAVKDPVILYKCLDSYAEEVV